MESLCSSTLADIIDAQPCKKAELADSCHEQVSLILKLSPDMTGL